VTRIVTLTALCGAVLAVAAPAATPPTRSIAANGPVIDLAADGGRVAFLVGLGHGCARVAVWSLPRNIVTLESGRSCLRQYSAREATGGLALAGTRVAWVRAGGGNTLETAVWTATLRARAPVLVGFGADGDGGVRVGHTRGDGALLVFAASHHCTSPGDPSAPSPSECRPGFRNGEVDRATVWRLATNGRPCPALGRRPGICVPVRETAEEQTPLAVDAGRVAVRRRSGTVEIVASDGRHLAAFRYGRGIALAAAMHGNDLVVQRPGAVDVFDLQTHAKVATHPLASRTPALEDVHAGVVVYVTAGQARALRLSDGRDVHIGPARRAQLEHAGLFYASGKRVGLLPRADLERRLG
jgi:hypothetical protein